MLHIGKFEQMSFPKISEKWQDRCDRQAWNGFFEGQAAPGTGQTTRLRPWFQTCRPKASGLLWAREGGPSEHFDDGQEVPFGRGHGREHRRWQSDRAKGAQTEMRRKDAERSQALLHGAGSPRGRTQTGFLRTALGGCLMVLDSQVDRAS